MTDELKKLMREQLNLMKREIKELEQKNRSSDRGVSERRGRIELLERLLKFYMVGKTRPVRLENGMIVNEILLNQIMKKIPASPSPEIETGEGMLVIKYYTKVGKGQFTLNDLSKYYGKWSVPERDVI